MLIYLRRDTLGNNNIKTATVTSESLFSKALKTNKYFIDKFFHQTILSDSKWSLVPMIEIHFNLSELFFMIGSFMSCFVFIFFDFDSANKFTLEFSYFQTQSLRSLRVCNKILSLAFRMSSESLHNSGSTLYENPENNDTDYKYS